MWGYYGAKTSVIDLYPAPIYDKIIEPFAGSARYALKYWEKDILLVDKYEILINIWKYLQKCSVKDIDRLPHFFKPGQKLSDFKFDCHEEKNLIGFLVGFGMQSPRKTASNKRMEQRPNHVNFSLNRISNNLYKIKHWNIILGDYIDIKNQQASWFIDPPYQFGGEYYKHSSKKINFDNLCNWCKERKGQTIVCENTKASWMPFVPMAIHKGATGMQNEAIWTNYHTHFNNVQQELNFNNHK